MICKNASKIKWKNIDQVEDSDRSLVIAQENRKIDLQNLPGYLTEPAST